METKIQIKSVFGTVLFEFEKENNTVKDTVVEANLRGADLRGANLYGADLRGADLRGADLRGADLRGADLRGANLREANLREANLRGANLRGADLYGANLYGADLYGANLREADLRGADLYGADLYGADLYGANLRGANLRGANLYGADLRGADLRGADLYGANLREADLRGIKFKNLPQDFINQSSRDILFILEHLKAEVPFLRKKLIAGEVDGSKYIGDCACLLGTLANGDGGLDAVCNRIPFYEKGTHNPGESWFLNIRMGDTPKNNEFAKHALMLIDMVLGKPGRKKKN